MIYRLNLVLNEKAPFGAYCVWLIWKIDHKLNCLFITVIGLQLINALTRASDKYNPFSSFYNRSSIYLRFFRR